MERLSANQHVDINYTGHTRFKNTSLLIVLRKSLSELDGLHQAKILAILNDYDNKYYITRTDFSILKSIYVRYLPKLVAHDAITAEDAAQVTLEIMEFEARSDELIKEYMLNNTRGNYEEVMRPIT